VPSDGNSTSKKQTSPNPEVLLDFTWFLNDLCNSNKTKIVWIFAILFHKSNDYWYWYKWATNIHNNIANTNTNTYLEKVLQYSGNTENLFGNTANTNTILQY